MSANCMNFWGKAKSWTALTALLVIVFWWSIHPFPHNRHLLRSKSHFLCPHQHLSFCSVFIPDLLSLKKNVVFLHQNMKEKLIGLSTCQIYKDGFCNFFNFVTFDGKVSAGSLILQSKLISHLSNCDNLQIEYFPQNTRLWHFPPQDLWYLLPLGQSRRMAGKA